MGGVTDQIYKRAPVAIQHALVSAYGWQQSEREIEYLLVIRDDLAALQLSRTAQFGVTQVSAPFAI